MLLAVFSTALVLVVGEPAMTLVHRRLFHGPLWCWHRSHHEFPSARNLVRNDVLWLLYFVLAAISFTLGVACFRLHLGEIFAGFGLGMAGYGMAYLLMHDGIAHRRFGVPLFLRNHPFARRLAQEHHHHHRGGVHGPGAAPFGVYSAPIERAHGWNADFVPRYPACSAEK